MNIEEEMNLKAKKYIAMIQQDYEGYLNPELIGQLLNQEKTVVIEESEMKWRQNQIEEIQNDSNLSEELKEKEIQNLKVPFAHGGKVFSDKIMHFYPFTTKDSGQVLKDKMEGILIHEIFHYFISPKVLSNQFQDKKMSSYITEGLVDMMCRDFQAKHQIHLNYKSNYENNVLYVRDELKNLTETQKMQMIFHGSIKDFLNINSKGELNSIEKLIEYQKEQTPFQQLLSEVASIPKEHNEGILRKLKNMASNANSQTEAIETIERNMNFVPEIKPYISEISKIITYYKNKQKLLEQRDQLEEQKIQNDQTIARKKINGFFQETMIFIITGIVGILLACILLK